MKSDTKRVRACLHMRHGREKGTEKRRAKKLTKKTPGVACRVKRVRKKENRRTHIDEMKRRNTKIFRPFFWLNSSKRLWKKRGSGANIIYTYRNVDRLVVENNNKVPCAGIEICRKKCVAAAAAAAQYSVDVQIQYLCFARLWFLPILFLLLFTVCILFLIIHFLLESESLTQ